MGSSWQACKYQTALFFTTLLVVELALLLQTLIIVLHQQYLVLFMRMVKLSEVHTWSVSNNCNIRITIAALWILVIIFPCINVSKIKRILSILQLWWSWLIQYVCAYKISLKIRDAFFFQCLTFYSRFYNLQIVLYHLILTGILNNFSKKNLFFPIWLNAWSN